MAITRLPSRIRHLLFLVFLIIVEPFLVEAAEPLYSFCGSNGNYTANNTYNESISSFLSTVSSDNAYFYNFSTGQSPDNVNRLALCRAGVSLSECRACLNESSFTILQRCPVQNEAVIWYDYCMLRYSNRSILGVKQTNPAFYMLNVGNSTSAGAFKEALRGLMDTLRVRAAAGNSVGKFAVGNVSGPDFYTIYGLAQCTPDLSQIDCNNCLDEAIRGIPVCCDGKIGGRWLNPSCNIRFEVQQFYDSSAEVPPASPPASPPVSSPVPTNTSTSPPPPPQIEGKSSNRTRTVIIVVVSVVATILLIAILFFFCQRKKKQTDNAGTADEIRSAESLQYDFTIIRNATDNFSEQNKLGQGGFGTVYQGKLPDGIDIAVKRLSRGLGQGDQEFKTEVLLVARLQHRNLVRLLGFSLSGDERLLVYEFVPNSSLDRFIFNPVKSPQLDWERRQKIIGGIARGMVYLHEDSRLRIIHRDLKASNVLLDADMTPKISDFGMARLFTVDQTHVATSRIVGTYGYMAPEYALYGQFSAKSDVFSFGVLVLEIVSGQKNNCFRHGETVTDLLTSVWRNWTEGTLQNIIDPALRDGSRTEILRCIHIGLLCVQENAGSRPTMASVLLMLNSFSISLPVPAQPALYMQSNTGLSLPFSTRDDSLNTRPNESEGKPVREDSADEASITELHPR